MKTYILRRIIIAALLSLLAVAPTAAQDSVHLLPTESLGALHHWQYGYSEDFGFGAKTKACVASGHYRSGTWITIARQQDGRWMFAASNPRWQSMRGGNSYDIAIKFHNRVGGRVTGSALGYHSSLGNGLMIGLNATSVEWLAASSGMALIYEGRQIDSFSLRGSRAVINELKNCFRDHIRNRDPFASRGPKIAALLNRLPNERSRGQTIPGTKWIYSEQRDKNKIRSCQIAFKDETHQIIAAVQPSGNINVVIDDKNWKRRINVDSGWKRGRDLTNAVLWVNDTKGSVGATIVNDDDFLFVLPKQHPLAITSFFASKSFGLVIGSLTAKWWSVPKLPIAWKRLKRCAIAPKLTPSWVVEGPTKTKKGGVTFCRVTSSERFSITMLRNDLNFFHGALADIYLAQSKVFQKLDTGGSYRAIIAASSGYNASIPFSLYGKKQRNGETLSTIGFNSSDFHLLKAIKDSEWIKIKFNNNAGDIVKSLKSWDFQITTSGASDAINKLDQCIR